MLHKYFYAQEHYLPQMKYSAAQQHFWKLKIRTVVTDEGTRVSQYDFLAESGTR